MSAEVWKPAFQLDGFEVSDLGRLRKIATGKIYSTYKASGNYRVFRPVLNGKITIFSAHRLVYQTFHGELPPKIEVDHINGVKADNRLANLDAVTRAENILRAKRLGLFASGQRHGSKTKPDSRARGAQSGPRQHPESRPRGERQHLSKLTEATVVEIRRRADAGERHSTIAADFGVSRPLISYVKLRKVWKHVP